MLGAMETSSQWRVARFGTYEVDLQSRRLTKSGYRIRLQDQPFQVLALLIERQGSVVSREELKERLWASDTFVAFDDGLNTAIKKLRAALSDTADNPRFVETIPRVGYRFVAPVSFSEQELVPEVNRSADLGGPPLASSDSTEIPETTPAPSSSRLSNHPLRWKLALVALFVAGALAFKFSKRPGPVSTSGEFEAIAVLPLQNMSNVPAQEYVADGMTDEIITDLAKLAGPKVISRTSAMQYKGSHKSIPEIARELNVGAVVEGSVERSGGRMRVRVQLIEASTDHHLWAESYDRELSDVLRLESDLAQDIARQIQLHLTPQQQQDFAKRQPLNPQAFQDYLQGRQYWAMRTDESLHKAIDYFNRAIEEDPNDARSYAGLAQCYIVLPMLTAIRQTETQPKAREAAQRALSLDASLPEAHLVLAEVEFYQNSDFSAAEQEFRKTLDLNPNYATGHQWYGEFLSLVGRSHEAISELEQAVALDPLSAIVHHQAGQTFQQARQYDRAIQEYQAALRLNPNLYVTYESMYWAYRRQGNFSAAAKAMQGASPFWQPEQGMGPIINRLASAYANGGRTGFLRQSVEMHKHFRDATVDLARDYADLGEKARSYQELDLAFASRDVLLLLILVDPEFDSMRSEARFRDLVRQISPTLVTN